VSIERRQGGGEAGGKGEGAGSREGRRGGAAPELKESQERRSSAWTPPPMRSVRAWAKAATAFSTRGAATLAARARSRPALSRRRRRTGVLAVRPGPGAAVVFQPAPEIPGQACASQKLDGTVHLAVHCGQGGRVEGPIVQKSSHPEFESPALQAVKRWQKLRAGQAQRRGGSIPDADSDQFKGSESMGDNGQSGQRYSWPRRLPRRTGGGRHGLDALADPEESSSSAPTACGDIEPRITPAEQQELAQVAVLMGTEGGADKARALLEKSLAGGKRRGGGESRQERRQARRSAPCTTSHWQHLLQPGRT